MKDIYRLHGFASPTDSAPSFSTPIFEKNKQYYVQIINDDESIAGFEEIENVGIHCHESQENKKYKRGDTAIYAVRDKFNYLTVETRSNLEKYLKLKIQYYIHAPFFYKAVSEFCKRELPEYIGCNTNRDYLLRQVISNSAREFSSKWSDDLVSARSHNKSYEKVSGKWLSIDSVASYKTKLGQATARELYKDFFEFAVQRNKKIAKEKVVIESLQVSKYVLPDSLSFDNVKLYQTREHLVRILEDTLQADSKTPARKRYHYLTWKGKAIDGAQHREMFLGTLDKKSTLNAISLIIFVTSIFSQFSDKDD
ncbi:hypothetical protein PS934_04553 [Pseudomonas fluorescens]|uniref:hypothetical protein n=1 Tax=Pseudomonas fluorescens TaxID=294 RepID=UPI0012419A5D|nr:hypothetical protein [Pseudomonas fluorescens]VVQ17841.1 hypothetical protein PS934_04553 [Pseudomonas fluorescens]